MNTLFSCLTIQMLLLKLHFSRKFFKTISIFLYLKGTGAIKVIQL